MPVGAELTDVEGAEVGAGEEKSGVGVVDGKACGSGDVEMSGLDVTNGTGGGGGVPGVPGTVCAKQTAPAPQATSMMTANADVPDFNATPREWADPGRYHIGGTVHSPTSLTTEGDRAIFGLANLLAASGIMEVL